MAKSKKQPAPKENRSGKKFPVKFIYHGRSIVIDWKKKHYHLTIDKEKIPVMKVGKAGFIAAPHAPMVLHQNLEELAMFITDNVINMRNDFPDLQILRNPTF